VVVEVLAPGHHNRPCPGFGGEVVSGQHLVFQTSWRLMEQKNPALTALEVAGRDLLRYTQKFGLTPAAELNLGKPPRPDAGDHDPFGA
jgi:phage terminase small subunit